MTAHVWVGRKKRILKESLCNSSRRGPKNESETVWGREEFDGFSPKKTIKLWEKTVHAGKNMTERSSTYFEAGIFHFKYRTIAKPLSAPHSYQNCRNV